MLNASVHKETNAGLSRTLGQRGTQTWFWSGNNCMGWDIFFQTIVGGNRLSQCPQMHVKKHQKDKNIYKQRENVFFGPVLV